MNGNAAGLTAQQSRVALVFQRFQSSVKRPCFKVFNGFYMLTGQSDQKNNRPLYTGFWKISRLHRTRCSALRTVVKAH